MRLSCAPVWILIPELRRAGGNEGRRIMRLAALRGGNNAGLPVLCGLLCAAASFSVVCLYFGLLTVDTSVNWSTIIIGLPFIAVGWSIGSSVAFCYQMWRACQKLVKTSRCARCNYSLCEVPKERCISIDGIATVSVRCPECGKKLVLADAGLCEWDLVPWEQREISPDVGINILSQQFKKSAPRDRSMHRDPGGEYSTREHEPAGPPLHR
mgnify:CR=1 FL=1